MNLQSHKLKMEVQVRIQLTDGHKAQNLLHGLEEHQQYRIKSASSNSNRWGEATLASPSPEHWMYCNNEITDIQSETREK